MAAVLESVQLLSPFPLQCPDLYDQVYDYFPHVTKTKVFQCFLEQQETTRDF